MGRFSRLAAADGAAADPQQRPGAIAQGPRPYLAAPVEQLRRVAHRLAQGAVVGVPPEVPRQPRLPGVHLDVHALIEAEFGVRAAEPRALHPAPGALAGAMAEGVVVDPDHPRL